MQNKWERRDKKQRKARLGHVGAGASHTREIAPEEVEGSIRKIKNRKKGK